MKTIRRTGMLHLALAMTGALGASTLASADELIVYPKKGQSQAQQEKDRSSCEQWAKKQLGYDPEMLLETSQAQAERQPPANARGGAVGGAAKGAAVGVLGGAIGGDVGKGAAIGAGVGAVGGAARRARTDAAIEANQATNTADINQKLAEFRKAEGACLEGKGYTVK